MSYWIDVQLTFPSTMFMAWQAWTKCQKIISRKSLIKSYDFWTISCWFSVNFKSWECLKSNSCRLNSLTKVSTSINYSTQLKPKLNLILMNSELKIPLKCSTWNEYIKNRSIKSVDLKFATKMKMWQKKTVKRHQHRHTKQKGAIKSGFNNFEFRCSIFMLDWYLVHSEAKIKSSRDSLRLKFNAQKQPGIEGQRENVETTFFQFITFKDWCAYSAREAARQNS